MGCGGIYNFRDICPSAEGVAISFQCPRTFWLKKKKNEALEGIQRQAMRMIYESGNDLCGKVKSTGEKQGKGDLMTVLKHSILHLGDWTRLSFEELELT